MSKVTKSSISGTILHSSAGSFEDIMRQQRSAEKFPPLKGVFVHAQECEGSFPIPVESPVINPVDAADVAFVSRAQAGFSAAGGRRLLDKEQVRGGGLPALTFASPA